MIEGNDADVIATLSHTTSGAMKMANSDADLIRRTLDGDASAFGFLVDKYKGAVHALAYRKIGNFHTAEDITQDYLSQSLPKTPHAQGLAAFSRLALQNSVTAVLDVVSTTSTTDAIARYR